SAPAVSRSFPAGSQSVAPPHGGFATERGDADCAEWTTGADNGSNLLDRSMRRAVELAELLKPKAQSPKPKAKYHLSLIALTRAVSPAMADCELTHLARTPIDVGRARAQHAAYELALTSLGCDVRQLPSGREIPDAVFIEDVAVVLDEVAVIT